jgi:membrane-bound ClpP family serine protease
VTTTLNWASAALWLLWTAGALMIVGRWLGLLRPRAGWLGLCLILIGAVAAFVERPVARALVMIGGVAAVVVLGLVSLKRGELIERPASPGDYEAELARLCGSQHKAEQLILEEQQRSPRSSRAGAAMAVVTRMRVEREGLGPPL